MVDKHVQDSAHHPAHSEDPHKSQTLPGARRFIENVFRDPSDVEGTDKEKLDAFREVREEVKEWLVDYFCKIC